MSENRAERKQPRLDGFNYAQAGYYYVTICTKDKRPLFWKSEPFWAGLGPAPTNAFGDIVRSVWEDLPNHIPGIRLDKFVVMPNHIHGIIQIRSAPVGAGPRPALQTPLPEIIRQFKSFSALRINERRDTPGLPIWQRSYYDHLIRDEADYLRIWKYMDENPAKWAEDEYHTK